MACIATAYVIKTYVLDVCVNNDVNKMQQLFRFLIFLNQPHMFRATNSSILRSTLFDCIYSFWYNATTLLSTGATVEMELNRGPSRQQCRCIVPKVVYIVKKSAPEDGRICRPKHVGLI